MPNTIAVYGATGRLGRFVSRELLAGGANLRLGGRDAHRLEAAAADVKGRAAWHVAPLDDQAGLRALLAGCRVVVNAGPTARGGDRLVRAALDAGVHYIDAAGAQPYIRHLFEDYGAEAERKGIAIVPSFGLDCALGDCLVRIVAGGQGPAREVVVAYAIVGADVSSNSLQHAAETPGGGEVLFEAGRWTPARLEIYRRSIDFPAPFGLQPMARYGSGEIVTVPRHTRADMVTSLVTASSLVPHPALVPLFPYLRPAVAVLRRTPARRLLALAVRLRGVHAQAPAVDRRPPRFAIVVSVEAKDGSRREGVIEGGDYHQVTAAILAFGARALASPAFSKRGTLPPAVAVDPEALLDSLRPLGVTWRVERSDTTPRAR